jgi:acetate kinase
VQGIAAMSAATQGIDILAFTGGVGENSAIVRRLTAERLGFLGVAIDSSRNDGVSGDTDISRAGAAAQTMVISAREDLQIASQARRILVSAKGLAPTPVPLLTPIAPV